MTQLRVVAGVWGLSPAQLGGNGARREIIQQSHPKKMLLSKLSFLSLGRANGTKPLSTSGSHFQIQAGLRSHCPQNTQFHRQPSQFCLCSPRQREWWARSWGLNSSTESSASLAPQEWSCSSPSANRREFQDLWQNQMDLLPGKGS